MKREIAFFIFGGTGDLARRKLYPVLSNLYRKGKLPGLRLICALGRDAGDRVPSERGAYILSGSSPKPV